MLSHLEFGGSLLDSLDLDPVYVGVGVADLPREVKVRWVFSYAFIYHSGVASKLAESADYYGSMLEALSGPRGVERRHFRGAAAVNAIHSLKSLGTPEELMDWVCEIPKFTEMARRVKLLPQCGAWIAFKIVDMADRILRVPVDWTGCSLAIYRDPKQGAALIFEGDKNAPLTPAEVTGYYAQLVEQFKHRLAPPWYDRPAGIPEVETIACKYKSYRRGGYHVGEDLATMIRQLEMYPGEVSQHILRVVRGGLF